MKNILIVALLFLVSTANAQTCLTGDGNIYNDTVIIGAGAVSGLDATYDVIAMASVGCVGSTNAVPQPGASAIALTVWLDDDLTAEVDGVLPNEEYQIFSRSSLGTLAPLVYSIPAEGDGIYPIMEATFDTTTTALVESVFAEIALMELELDSLYSADSTVIALQSDLITSQGNQIAAQSTQIATLQSSNAALQQNVNDQVADITALTLVVANHLTTISSLQAQIDGFPDISVLQADLDVANARVIELEDEISLVNVQLASVLNTIRRIIAIVNRQGNKYRDILNVLNPD